LHSRSTPTSPTVIRYLDTGGIDLNKPRIRAAWHRHSRSPPPRTGFTVAEFTAKVSGMTGQASYTIRQGAYDLRKLRGKQLIDKTRKDTPLPRPAARCPHHRRAAHPPRPRDRTDHRQNPQPPARAQARHLPGTQSSRSTSAGTSASAWARWSRRSTRCCCGCIHCPATPAGHAAGGRINHFSRHPVRYKAWTFVSRLTPNHGNFAWLSLVWVALTDLYVRLVASGAITDPRVF
jgi:hypothetical protein